MRPGDIFLVFALAIVIAIPLALAANSISRWWKFRKIIQAMERKREPEPNIVPADGFNLQQAGTKYRQPRRKSNVTALKRDPPRAA